MALIENCSIFVLLLVALWVCSVRAQRCDPPCKAFSPYFCNNTAVFNRKDFPPSFTFGAATSAYQIEGAQARAFNSWDLFTHRYPEKTVDRSNGDMACDSYNLFRNDIALLKQINADAYRFSIAWSRVLPKGRLSGGVDERGIAYYNNVIDELVANGIRPFITLFHWDVPQTLNDEYGGFLSPRIVADYRNYADLCFKRFGNKVKNWITFNQPLTVAIKGYGDGTHAPGRCTTCESGESATESYIVGYYELLAHAEAVALYRRKYKNTQGGMIGITLIGRWFNPYNLSSPADIAASRRAFDFYVGWFLDPITRGDYPEIMKSIVGRRLPRFTLTQSYLLRGSFDFLGINYYITQYAIDVPPPYPTPSSFLLDTRINLTFIRNGVPIGPAGFTFNYYPVGFREILTYIKERYNNPLIYITENGLSTNGRLPVAQTLADQERIEFQCSHLSCLRCAIQNGSNVQGYFIWTLIDNYEFVAGYTVRFGLNYINFNNVTDRSPKLSARWYSNFLRKPGQFN